MGAHLARGPATSTAVMAAATDHVRLSYDYLDNGDLDGYASLLHPAAELRTPGRGPTVRGRDRIVQWFASDDGRGRHVVREVVGLADRIAVTGRLVGRGAAARGDLGFADVFQVSDAGLLITQTRYYFTDPG